MTLSCNHCNNFLLLVHIWYHAVIFVNINSLQYSAPNCLWILYRQPILASISTKPPTSYWGHQINQHYRYCWIVRVCNLLAIASNIITNSGIHVRIIVMLKFPYMIHYTWYCPPSLIMNAFHGCTFLHGYPTLQCLLFRAICQKTRSG